MEEKALFILHFLHFTISFAVIIKGLYMDVIYDTQG